MSKCGECLMNDAVIIELGKDGKCPRCGADYGGKAHGEQEKHEAVVTTIRTDGSQR